LSILEIARESGEMIAEFVAVVVGGGGLQPNVEVRTKRSIHAPAHTQARANARQEAGRNITEVVSTGKTSGGVTEMQKAI
jgi:isocitrate dehydrogenase